MVDTHKLESIAFAISQQAGLLRSAGRISEANGMDRRADELRALAANRSHNEPIPFHRQAA
ncbi:MAG: hypothetical protein WAU86_20680 [Oricola sp.]